MNQSQHDHTILGLLAFYDRVNPVLSKWLAKQAWTATETAMLCAGLVPVDKINDEIAAVSDLQELIEGGTPSDPEGYLPPDYELYGGYLRSLIGKGVGAPREMLEMLRPAITCATSSIEDNGVPTLRVQTIDSLRNLQWLLIIGNAVGLDVPAVVPFGLLNGLRDRLTGQSVPDPATSQVENKPSTSKKPFGKLKAVRTVVDQASGAEPSVNRQKPRGRQALPTTPEERGYYKTEEVAGLTNLLPDTLNTYARKGIVVEGFTPFKRQNGRSWQWRDGAQQDIHVASTAGHPKLDATQAKSLTALLGPNPFNKQ